MASEELTGLSNIFARQNSTSGISLDFEPDTDYHFVETLEERYKCAYCHLVLHNPHQTGCGHRFCQHCIISLREFNAVPTCPVDKETIKAHEVFKDNCCKREVLNLQVFCKNVPQCNSKIILGRYQDHLQQCLFESVQCTNDECQDQILRKDLKDHLSLHCKFREEICQYCNQYVVSIHLKNHEKNECPDFPVPCLHNCSQIILKKEMDKHFCVCPEAEVDCPYKQYGCPVKIKRGKLAEHENAALREHMLQILDKNSKLEEQISDLYKSLEFKEIKIQQLADTVKKCEKEFRQFAQLLGKNSNLMVNTQTLASHIDKSAWLETQVRQLIQMSNEQQSKFDLRPLLETIENVKQKISFMETYDQRLVVLEGQSNKHDVHIGLHKAQINKNEERFKLLEGTCYNGKLIWKIMDYKMKKKEAMEGRTVSIFSQPFYTSRCGYRLCARAYLNGDGSGKGTHVSLYFVVMRGEFDSLLPWPFKQKVTLMLLDQSGKKNHIVEVFRADPNSSSFKRPDGEMNIASGCPRFVAHTVLENAKNTYVKDDTLFLKVVVDLTDLEEL
ncbi:TNF receptor-associated factor 5 isoform X1 [Caretta caretta]|uniref:TNF receptor-associated factor 5 isoform X1 n=1 Tax=Caretta caretta TaxID=8467 RepID=UPI002095BB19|nr:TNF receptor-associated factor 5 isoform X1 [Caretta caretta]XP_048699057.1 TNF receptor-associated factor 5 isoform X1 [Caretta caretta]XP_048699058.1 TNF receptor-associated factor 5 isoform X1 [Caretta caretta]